jgi:cell division transport system permease protein
MIRIGSDRRDGLIAAAALLTCIATLAIGAAAALGHAAVEIERRPRVVSVAIAASDPALQVERSAGVLAMLHRRGDLSASRFVDPAVVRRDMQMEDDAPVPALIDATLRPGAPADGIRRALNGLPGVSVADDDAALDSAAVALRKLDMLARTIALAALVGGLVVGVAWGWGERQAIALLARLGAGDGQIALASAWMVARGAAIGAATGFVLGTLAWPFMAAQASSLDSGGMAGLGTGGAIGMVAAPLLIVALAALGGVLGALLRLERGA